MRGASPRHGFKPRDVEEPIDEWFHRPLASRLVELLLPSSITPNQVTWASGAAGLMAGVVIAMGALGGHWWVFAGGFVVLLGVLLDCADGQLARLRACSSMVGRALDGFMDMATPLSVFHGWALFLLSRHYSFWLIWPVGLAAAASLAWHAAQYDAAKNIYLHCTRPDVCLGGSTLLSVNDIEQERRQRAADGDRFGALLMGIWARWTRSQARAATPWLGGLSAQSARERLLFTTIFAHDMRSWRWLGFGTHMILFQAMCWLTPLSDVAIWTGWAIMLGPMNGLCLWLRWRRPGLVAHYQTEVARLRAEES
jgi:phosphatidylglycerophosphate synthase